MALTQNQIAGVSLAMAVGLEVFLFSESRNDPSLRIAALVSGTALVASLASIASTLLTGKDVTSKQDVPPGSVQTLQVPPLQPEVTVTTTATPMEPPSAS